MWRKVFFLIVVVCLTVPLVALAQDEAITLNFSQFTLSDPETGPALAVQDALDRFAAEHPSVTVNVETMPHDEYYTKFRVLAASNELPDVFIMNADMTTPLVNGSMLLDLTDVLNADPEWRDLQLPGGMAEWTVGGQNYGVGAQMIITHVIYYNKTIFAEAGINEFPSTWEDFTNAVTALKDAGYTPIALGSKAGWPLFDCLFGTLSFRATGLDWYNRLLKHEASFTDPEFMTALNAFQQLVDLGAFNADATSLDNVQAESLYYNKQAAMFIEGNWAIPGITNDAPADVSENTGMALWPALPGGLGEPNGVTWAAGWGWSANGNLEGAKRDAAIDLIKLLSDETYGRIRYEHGDLPAQPVASEDTERFASAVCRNQRDVAGLECRSDSDTGAAARLWSAAR